MDFCRIINKNSKVENCAALVWKSYPRIEFCLKTACFENDSRLRTPFGRGLRPDLAMDPPTEAKAAFLKHKLSEKGIQVYKSKIKKFLAHHQGKIDKDEILNLVRASQSSDLSKISDHTAGISLDLSDLDLSEIPGLRIHPRFMIPCQHPGTGNGTVITATIFTITFGWWIGLRKRQVPVFMFKRWRNTGNWSARSNMLLS